MLASYTLQLLTPAGPYVTHLSFQHVFDDASMDLHSFTGWMVVLTNVINSLAAALSLMFVVRRIPLCIDKVLLFAVSLHLMLLFVCLT